MEKWGLNVYLDLLDEEPLLLGAMSTFFGAVNVGTGLGCGQKATAYNFERT